MDRFQRSALAKLIQPGIGHTSLPELSTSPHSLKMHLAQELVDHIIDFLHDDPTTLIRISLVSRPWVGRARTYLCESLKITRPKLLSSNPSYLAPLCEYVKTLHFTWPRDLTEPPAILDCFERSELHTLTIHSCELRGLDEQTIRRCFAKFPCASVTTLELHDISPTHRTLVTFLSMFPNVDNLAISVNRWWADKPAPISSGDNHDETIKYTSPPCLRGSFKFFDPPGQGFWGFHRSNLLRTIATLPLQFQTVSLNIRAQSWEEVLTFLSSCSETVRKVYIGPPCRKPRLCVPSAVPRAQRSCIVNQPIDQPLPINFANLEELYVDVWAPRDPLTQHIRLLLRSVTSPCLRRVIVELCDKEIRYIRRSRLDDALANLIERHRAYGNLALQISTKADPERVRQSLPRVAQEGVLEVKHSERPGYWA